MKNDEEGMKRKGSRIGRSEQDQIKTKESGRKREKEGIRKNEELRIKN
jgi:hypothetical protein